jgi:ABC-type nitrate/sulfonate/bicarbonate transport system permease component
VANAKRKKAPVFLGLQTLPSVCWVPIAILIFGFSETGILFFLVMGSTFDIAISMRDAGQSHIPLFPLALHSRRSEAERSEVPTCRELG